MRAEAQRCAHFHAANLRSAGTAWSLPLRGHHFLFTSCRLLVPWMVACKRSNVQSSSPPRRGYGSEIVYLSRSMPISSFATPLALWVDSGITAQRCVMLSVYFDGAIVVCSPPHSFTRGQVAVPRYRGIRPYHCFTNAALTRALLSSVLASLSLEFHREPKSDWWLRPSLHSMRRGFVFDSSPD